MRDRGAATYDELWRWSVDDLEGFWAAIWERFGVDSAYDAVLPDASMPGAVWFPGARAELRRAPLPRQARRPRRDRARLRAAPGRRLDVGRAARAHRPDPRRAGRARGRAAATAWPPTCPNLPETVAAFLATASLGAVWSSAAPEFGVAQRLRPLRADRAQGAARDRRLPLRRQGLRPRAKRCAPSPTETGAEPIRLGYLDGSGWEDGFLGEPAARVRARRRSTIRCGCSTRRARPACRRRSSTARAASCSSTSR